jgi:hypothetical protein
MLSEGDVLAVVGSHDAVEGARSLLAAEPLAPVSEGD